MPIEPRKAAGVTRRTGDLTEEQRAASKPPMRLVPSALDRHQLERFSASTFVRPRTTVTLPGVDIAAELELINRGYGERVGDSRYRINDRIYVHKPNGATYPESGDQVVDIPRPELLILRLLIRHHGRTVAFDRATERNPHFTEDRIANALKLYRIWKESQR